MRYRRARFIVVAAIIIGFLSFALLAAQAPVWKGKILKDGDITIVQNPKEPMYPTGGGLTLETELTIGAGLAGDAMIGTISAIAVSNDGRIFIGDLKQNNVKIFGPDGRFIRLFGRKGQGPGEFMGPVSVGFSEKRKEVFIDGLLAGSIFDRDGKFVRRIIYKKRFYGVRQADDGSLVGIRVVRTDNKSFNALVRSADPDAPDQVMAQFPLPDYTNIDPFRPVEAWNMAADGAIAEGYPDKYEIRIHDAAGRLVRIVRREYDPVPVTDAEKQENLKSTPPGVLAETKIHFGAYHAAFRGITMDEKGRLYVQTWERPAEGAKFMTDVFDAQGRYVAKLEGLGRISCVLNERLYLIDEDADGYPLVIRKALIWPKSGSQ